MPRASDPIGLNTAALSGIRRQTLHTMHHTETRSWPNEGDVNPHLSHFHLHLSHVCGDNMQRVNLTRSTRLLCASQGPTRSRPVALRQPGYRGLGARPLPSVRPV